MSAPDEIGVLLYLPATLRGHQIAAQGLARHALVVTAAMARSGTSPVTVVTSHWARPAVHAALADLAGNHRDRVTVVSRRGPSPAEAVTRLLLSLDRSGPRRARDRRRLRSFAGAVGQASAWLLSTWAGLLVTLVVAFGALAALLGLALAFGATTRRILVPVVGIAVIVAVVIWFARRPTWRRRAGRVLSSVRARRSRVRSGVNLLLEGADVAAVVRRANRTGARHWWVPIGMYAAATGLKGTTATTFADFVPAEFPGMLVDQPAFVARGRQMARLLSGSDVIICLSDHVRRRQLPYLVPEPAAEVVVIAPGPPDRGASVRFDAASGDQVGAVTALLRQRFPGARAAVPDWWSRPTIVVPSQDRPYKNLASLVEAVAYLNRREQRMVRIVLTARPDPAHISRVVQDAGAVAFVEFLPDLPDEELDLVLACASLAVTPSLFEGSLPFTLYEAVSVGTPCLMADIPVTRAAFAGHSDVEAVTVFDATDPRRAAAAIAAALDRRAELLSLQRGFVADYYRENSWDACAARYGEVLLGQRRSDGGTS